MTTAQIIQLCATDMRVSSNFDLFDARRLEQERALDANTVRGDAPHREAGIGTAPFAEAHHSPVENLNTFAVTFDDACMHLDAVAG